MAVIFSLENRKTRELETFNYIDKVLCKEFNQPVSEDKWLADWYNSIGMRLALGKDWNYIRNALSHIPALVLIADFLEKNYIVHSSITK